MSWHRHGIGILLVAASLTSGTASATTGESTQVQGSSTDSLIEHYLAIQTALAGDSLERVPEHAAAIRALAFAAVQEAPQKRDHPSAPSMATATARLTQAQNIEDARLAFGELSDLLIRENELIRADDLKVAYCPMADQHWLQTGDRIANPYYGAKMLRCGRFVDQSSKTSAE